MTSICFNPMIISKTVTGQALIKVQMSQALIGTFLVDTGSPTSFISATLAQKLGLVTEPAVSNGKPFFVAGKQAVMTSVAMLKIGGLNIPKQPLVVASDQFLSLPSASSFDGIIGINILHRMAVQWDFKRRLLTLYFPGQLTSHDLGQLNFVDPSTLSLADDNGKNGLWCTAVKMTNGFASIDQKLMVDTGSNLTTIPNSTAQYLGLKPYTQKLSLTVIGSSILDLANVETLQVGDLTLPKFPVSIRAASSKNEAYVLGLDVLSNYQVLMDFPGKKMYLQPNTAAVPAVTVGPAPATTAPPAK